MFADVATSAVGGALVGVPLSWEPFYCVLQQDRQILTAYTSEELAVSTINFNHEIPVLELNIRLNWSNDDIAI